MKTILSRISADKQHFISNMSSALLILLLCFAPNVFAASTDDFVITVKTDNTSSSLDTQFTIPTTGTGYNYSVDCQDDGSNEATGQTGNYTCNYATAGTYTIRIEHQAGGTGFPRIYFNNTADKLKLLSIKHWGTGKWQSMANAFSGCENLVSNATDTPDFSDVTDMQYMFNYALAFNGDSHIKDWDVSNVTDMSFMFRENHIFNKDIGSWTVSSVTNMNSMFWNAKVFNQDLNSWQVSSVTDMNSMFYDGFVFNGNIRNWVVDNVTDMSSMFQNAAKFNQDLNLWNTSSVTDMHSMFVEAHVFNGNISSWTVSNVTDMHSMFQHAKSFNQDLSSWNVSSVTNMASMFGFALIFNQDLSSWVVSNVTSMHTMFQNANSFNQDLSSWNVSSVTDMAAMFILAAKFDQNLSTWNVSSVTNMDSMFKFAKLSPLNYDALLNGWNALPLQPGISFDGGLSEYCAVNSHSNMITSHGWTIKDGGEFAFCLRENMPVTTPTSDSTPDYFFSSFTGGTITYGGACSSSTTTAVAGNNTITFNALPDGTHTNCTITVTDAWANSHTIKVPPFEIDSAFTIKVDTSITGVSSSTQFRIPTTGSGYNYSVDCNGDGVNETTGQTGDYTCDYTTAGPQTIRITPQADGSGFPRIYFNKEGDSSKLKEITNWGGVKWQSMEGAFKGCNNLVGLGTGADRSVPDLSDVTSMSHMFSWATELTNGTDAQWDTSNVIDMSYLFSEAFKFNGLVKSWDVSNVTNMRDMFTNAAVFDQDLSSWNVSSVTNMSRMFEGASSYRGVGIQQWVVSSVTDMERMFDHAQAFREPISTWTVSSVTNMYSMFAHAFSFNNDLAGWDVSNVTNMESMFQSAVTFNQDLSSWDVSSVTNMAYMFQSAVRFNQDLSSWGVSVSKVTNMEHMFSNAFAFDQPLLWDVSSVTNMSNMFSGARSFNQDLNTWTVTNVTDMSFMFSTASSFDGDIGNWDVSSVTSMRDMFNSASDFNQDIGNWDVSDVTTMDAMFDNVTLSLQNYDALLNGWNALTLQTGVPFSGGNSLYCAVNSRSNMTSSDGWSITDGGEAACLVEKTPVATPTANSTPDYTFTSLTGGTITYGGSCSSSATTAVAGDNTITFNDLPSGTYSNCSIVVTDAAGNAHTLKVTTFTVASAPVAADDHYSISEDGTLKIAAPGVLANDHDPALRPLTAVLGTDVSHGSLALDSNGQFVYIPTLLFSGLDSFSYRAHNNNNGISIAATVSLTVNHINHAPVAIADAATTHENTPGANINVLGNDLDPDGDTLQVVKKTDPAHGSVILNADNTFTYTPAANYNGTDSFDYLAFDGHTQSNIVAVNIIVTAVNDAPQAIGDVYTIAEDTPLVVTAANGVLNNDTDPEGNPITAQPVNPPIHGTLKLSADGSFHYTPASNFNGDDQFTYHANDGHLDSGDVTVIIHITPDNDPPVASADAYNVHEDTVLTIDSQTGLLNNDSDPENNPLTVRLSAKVSHGLLHLHKDGSFRYTPAANYTGTDEFTYVANDGQLSSSPVKVTLIIDAINDAPTASADAYSIGQNGLLKVALPQGVLANDHDTDGDILHVVLTGAGVTNGILKMHLDGHFNYQPNTGFYGVDTFSYKASDNQLSSSEVSVSINVSHVNTAPQPAEDAYSVAKNGILNVLAVNGVLANDLDPDGDVLTVISVISDVNQGSLHLQTDGSFIYKPAAGYSGMDSFSYRVSDGTLESNTVTVTINVHVTNQAPVAVNDSYTIASDTVLQVSAANGLLINDSDPDGNVLRVIIRTQPQHGTLHSAADGSFTYRPASGYSGADSFSYSANDGVADSPEVSVSIDVHAINHPPIVNPATYQVLPNTVLQVGKNNGVLLGATDQNNNLIYATLVTGAAHGSVHLLPDGSFTYRPNPGYTGTDTFVVTATDGHSHSAQTTITLNVSYATLPPPAAAKPIPTMSQWAVILLSLLMLMLGGRFRYRVK